MAASLQFRLTGGASNSDPDASLGGTSSSNQVSGTAMNNIFDNVSAAEAVAGDTSYRAIDIYNAGDATASGVEIYMETETSSTDSSIDLGIDNTDEIDNTTTIAAEANAPGNVTFGHYTTASKLALADIPASSYARVWLKRVISAGAGNTSNDQGTIEVVYA